MPVPDDDANAKAATAASSSSRSASASSLASPGKSPFGSLFDFHASRGVKAFAKRYRTEIAASSSSVLSTGLAFPLDFAKSRMQSYETSFLATVKDAYKAEGLRAFWRGVGPPMLSVMVVRTISFSLYQKAKYAIDDSITQMTGSSPLVIANAPGSYPTLSTMFTFAAAGATAGAVITTISCPFELTKLNEQLAGKMAREAAAVNAGGTEPTGAGVKIDLRSGGSWATARRLVRDRGWTGLYAGYRLHLLRDTIGTSIYFMTYESAKQILGNARGKSATSPYAVVVAGGLCGIVSWACIYPIDVAKTLYQKSLLSTCMPNFSNDSKAATGGQKTPSSSGSGPHTSNKNSSHRLPLPRTRIQFFQMGSYRGLGVSVLRSCIINMIFFSNFEVVKKWINALEV